MAFCIESVEIFERHGHFPQRSRWNISVSRAEFECRLAYFIRVLFRLTSDIVIFLSDRRLYLHKLKIAILEHKEGYYFVFQDFVSLDELELFCEPL